MTEDIYSVEEAAELLGLTTSGVSLYHKRYKNIGIVKKIKGCPKGRLYFSESDIAFMRERVGKKRQGIKVYGGYNHWDLAAFREKQKSRGKSHCVSC